MLIHRRKRRFRRISRAGVPRALRVTCAVTVFVSASSGVTTVRAQSVGVPLEAGSGQEDRAQQPEPTQDLLWRTAEHRSTSLLRVQAGVDRVGDPTFNGTGRFFGYLDERTGFQAQGALDYSDDRREGQFDVGLVRRVQSTQVGLFASFKYASFRQFDEGGLLAQAAATFDYLFPRARLGLFGTKRVPGPCRAAAGRSAAGR